jgi:hypothetical protein
MSRDTYTPYMKHGGLGNLAYYTFSFKITALTQLLIVEYNASGVETQRVRGDDTTYLSSGTPPTFDAVNGAGDITLAANLTNNYTLFILLADDAPTQTQEYRGKTSFTLKNFELGFDFLSGQIQRLAYLAQKSLKTPDLALLADFDPTLPAEITDAVSRTIVTDALGTKLEIGPTATEISLAQGYAVAALASQNAAATSETNAATSASAAAASASAASSSETAAAASLAAMNAALATLWSAWEQFSITAGQAATTMTGQTVDSTVYSSRIYEYEVLRGTTIIGNGRFTMQDLNGTWRLLTGDYEAAEVHGLTFSISQATTIGTLQVAANAGSNGTVKISSRLIPV